MKRLYSGFDGLDVTFQGVMSPEAIAVLIDAKEKAQETGSPVLVEIGPGRLPAHVHAGGAKRFPYRFDTGPEGEIWFVNKGRDPHQWNIRVSVRAAALAANGYGAIKHRLFERLEAMGARVVDHRIGRVDWAVDFLASNFVLLPGDISCHHATTIDVPGDVIDDADEISRLIGRYELPGMTLYNGSVSSLRIGKMPGRQIAVYNKRREVLKRKKEKGFWWDIWKLDPKDRCNIVWRVELRAGKDALRKAQIDRFEDLEQRLPNLLLWTLKKAQLKAPKQSDSNRTRQEVHYLWRLVETEVRSAFVHKEPVIKPERIVTLHRAALKEIVESQLKGAAPTLALAMGIPPENADMLDLHYARLAREAIKRDPEEFARKYAKRQERYHFIDPRRRTSGAA